jgi:hypothetical protein
MKEIFKFRITGWGVLGLTLVWILVMNLFADYVISRPVDSLVQIAASFIALVYSVWQGQIIINYITNTFNTKEK